MFHNFVDNNGREYYFTVNTKKGLNSSLEIKIITTVTIYYLYSNRYNKLSVREDIINDEYSWRKTYPFYPEELRVYLKKFIKLLVFS